MADRETTVKLNLAAGGNGKQALDTTAAAAKALTEQLSRLRAEAGQLARSLPGQGAAAGAPGGPSAGLAGMLRYGLAASGALMAVHTATMLARSGAGAINTLRRDDLPADRKVESVLGQLPIVGGLISALGELRRAIDGTAETMRRMNREHAFAMRGIELGGQLGRQVFAAGATYRGAAFAAGAFAGVPQVGIGDTGRTTLEQQIAYQEQQRLIPARLGLRSAQAREAGLRGQHEAARQDAAQAQLAADAARERSRRALRAAQQAARGPAGLSQAQQVALAGARYLVPGALGVDAAAGRQGEVEVNRLRTAQEAARALAEEQNALNRLQDANNRSRETGLQLAQAESQARQRQVELSRAELENLRAREQLATSGARRIGAMTPMEREYALQAAQMVQQFGLEGLPRETRERARGLVPGLIGNLEEQEGVRFARERGLAALSPEFRDVGRLEELRRAQVDRVQAEVTVSVQIDEERLAQRIMEIGRDYFRAVQTEARQRFANDQERQRTNLLIQQANGQ